MESNSNPLPVPMEADQELDRLAEVLCANPVVVQGLIGVFRNTENDTQNASDEGGRPFYEASRSANWFDTDMPRCFQPFITEDSSNVANSLGVR